MHESENLVRVMVLKEFLPLVGYTFLADCVPQPVGIVLTEAYPLRNDPAFERPPFILIFRSDPMAQLIGGSYVLRCGEWGPVQLDIHPIAAPLGGEPGYYYQSIFA
jgi:hypothetical protein